MSIKGSKVVVLGANANGLALLRYLHKHNAQVSLADPRPRDLVQAIVSSSPLLEGLKVTLEAGEGLTPATFESAQMIVLTPDYGADHRLLEGARARGVEIVSELEFVGRCCRKPIIAVTGSNGKATTAYLLQLMLEADDKAAFSNFERPLADVLNLSKGPEFVVAVTRAKELEAAPQFRPAAVVALNAAVEDSRRYPDFESYAALLRSVAKNANEETLLVVNREESALAPLFQNSAVRALGFAGMDSGGPGAWYNKTHVQLRLSSGKQMSFSLANCRLRGQHNRENLAAAALAAASLGVKQESIMHVVENARAPHHRVQFVKRINSVAFYDDSCATNMQSTLKTLQSFNEPVILIAGGRDTCEDYSPLAPHVRQRVKNLILLGEAKEKLNRMIGDFTETFLVGTLEEAVIMAYQKSRSGDVVLLSPACEESDMFRTPAERGEVFAKQIEAMSRPRQPNVI